MSKLDVCDVGSRQQMENYIVKEFQNLHVLSTCNLERMDELVQDLTNALEETARPHGGENSMPAIVRRQHKRRKGRKRRSNPHMMWECGNFSEASESSIDEALKDFMQNVARQSQSDSDELGTIRRLSQMTIPVANNIPPVESDSVTENFSPMRPQRRRRKFKSMSIDQSPCISIPRLQRTQHKQRTLYDTNLNIDFEYYEPGIKIFDTTEECIQPGKRKRSMKKCDYQCASVAVNRRDKMEISSFNQETTSSLSSSDSDGGIVTNDEAREADDEQSDFFHEAGPACGIPGIIPWWEGDRVDNEDKEVEDNFERILTGTFELLPKSSQLSYKARVKKLMCGRQIRSGRRKLKGKIPGYTMSRFLQEQQKWSTLQRYRSVGNNSQACDPKRRRKTPPSSPLSDEFIGENADPIPESNIGSRLLRNMGWIPGSGLGLHRNGIIDPLKACLHPKRQGLGYFTSQQSDS